MEILQTDSMNHQSLYPVFETIQSDLILIINENSPTYNMQHFTNYETLRNSEQTIEISRRAQNAL